MSILKMIYYGLLATSLAALFFNLRKLPAYCGWFVALIGLAIITQVASEFLEARNINSYFLFHLYQPVEFCLLCGFYYRMLTFKKTVLLLSALGIYALLLGVHYMFNPDSFRRGDFFDFTAEAALNCLLIIIFFAQLLLNRERIDLAHFTGFWLNAANLIFYGGCLFVMGFYFYIKSIDPGLARSALRINHYLNLFLYAAYAIIFVWTAKNK